MPEETKYECPECGTSVAESETKCPGCGAVFEEGGEEGSREPEVAIVTAEKVEDETDEPVKEAEKVEGEGAEPESGAETTDADEADDAGEEKEEDEGTPAEAAKDDQATGPKNAGPNKGGLVIALVGGLGIVGAAMLDPLMNMLDSNHPGDISIGPTQMLGIAAAAVVLVVGVVVAFAMRRKA